MNSPYDHSDVSTVSYTITVNCTDGDVHIQLLSQKLPVKDTQWFQTKFTARDFETSLMNCIHLLTQMESNDIHIKHSVTTAIESSDVLPMTENTQINKVKDSRKKHTKQKLTKLRHEKLTVHDTDKTETLQMDAEHDICKSRDKINNDHNKLINNEDLAEKKPLTLSDVLCTATEFNDIFQNGFTDDVIDVSEVTRSRSDVTGVRLDEHKDNETNVLKLDNKTGIVTPEILSDYKHCDSIDNTRDDKHDSLESLHYSDHADSTNVTKATKSWTCEMCGRNFARKNNLQSHIRTHDTVKAFPCVDHCASSFNSKDELRRHILRYTGTRNHICAECGRTFTTKSDLKSHRNVHSDVKSHQCSECGKTFTRLNQLTRHNLTHTGEKKVQCTICGKSFATMHCLTLHNYTHTGQQPRPYVCCLCNKSFVKSSHLKRHRQTKYHLRT